MDELKKAIMYMGPVVLLSQLHPLAEAVGVVVILVYSLNTFVRMGVLPSAMMGTLLLAVAVVGGAVALNWVAR
jgi:hypothetical protein